MKKAVLFSVILMSSGIAQADMIRTVITVFQCSTQSGKSIEVKSANNGSYIQENGKTVWEQPQPLSAGTEGGPAYMQAVGGGYNITVSGGVFEKAWSSNSVVRGDFVANVWERSSGKGATAKCYGGFRFL